MKRLIPILIYALLMGAIALISAYSIEEYPACHTDSECEAIDNRLGKGWGDD